MRLDLVIHNEGDIAGESLRAAPDFEAMGYDGLWFTDHIIAIEGATGTHASYWYEMLSTMAWVAAKTKRVRLGAGVLVAPHRDPLLAAKTIATIDDLSDGRFDLGVGTGWARREFNALGRGDVYEQRGAVTDEALDVMLNAWKGGWIEFDGQWSKYRKIRFEPHPPSGRIPLWIGARGLGGAPMRRAAKYADYWHPTGVTPDEIREGGAKLDEMAGRKVQRSARVRFDGDAGQMADLLAQYKDAGCVQVACCFDEPETLADFRRASERFLEAARKVVPA